MAYPREQRTNGRSRRRGGQLGLVPAVAVPLAKKVAGKIVGGAKKLVGMGPDPRHHASRENAIATALRLAQGGNLAAFLWLRAMTGGFNRREFQIPVPPIPELNFTGGIATGLGDKEARADARRAYASVKALFPQVPEHGNTIATVASAGGGQVAPGTPSGGGAGGSASGDTNTPPVQGDAPAGAPQEAGMGKILGFGLLGAALVAALSGRSGGRRRRRA